MMPLWAIAGVGGAVAAGAALFVIDMRESAAHAEGLKAGRAEIQVKWDADKLVRSTTALTAMQDMRKDYEQKVKEANDAAVQAKTTADRARRDRDAGVDERDGLRNYADALAASCSPAERPGPAASGGEATATPGLVLANMLRRVDEVAEELAFELDLAHSAGTACERIHEPALNKEQP